MASPFSAANPAQNKRIDPYALRAHYDAFLSARDRRRSGSLMPRRILLTGHSHQAWPDVAETGLLEAFRDAALHVDDKWQSAFAVIDEVRAAIAARIGGQANQYAFGSSTHELLVRFLGSLDLRNRRHIVTTTGEFHSAHRQLRRLSEEGVAITWVPTAPVATLAERMAAELRDDTAAVLCSTVLFETSEVIPHLSSLTQAAQKRGTAVLYDAYHAFTTLPFSLTDLGPDPLFLVAGGYKYAQWGEGVCFLRVPPATPLRPLCTGWFADFASLGHHAPIDAPVLYSAEGAWRYAGSTFDPTSFYRARAVCRFFDIQGMSVPALRTLSLAQTQLLRQGLARLPGLQVVTPEPADERGGFIAVQTPRADELVDELRHEGIYTDARGGLLRFGPAPYVTPDEIDLALDILRLLLRSRPITSTST